MHHHQKAVLPKDAPKVIDVTDGDVVLARRAANIRTIDMQLYFKLVEETLQKLFDTSPVLQKIRRGESVSPRDLTSLTSLVLTQNPDVNLELLKEFYPDSAPPLDYIIRTIVGMEPVAVEARFAAFARKFSENAKQTQFLRLLKNHINKYGAISVDRLYEEPFTSIDSNGLDGVFHDDSQINELMNILKTFEPTEIERGAQA
jgi:type I restriction enzyme R subunit